ncbi:uncharacterized protein LAESUDRAFT_643457, partial [Laetiporus sulphureus 93-53]
LADGSFMKAGMSLQMYLRMASQLAQHLTLHHTIEEKQIFPFLSKRMHMFREDDVHIKSHEAIYDGLENLNVLIRKWTLSPSTYSPVEMKKCLASWKEVLFTHLDHEVEDLFGENMKRCWKLEELDLIPM